MIRRNEACACGSGKRYKVCCGALGSPTGSGWNILVMDDYFPNLLTGFRIAEYNAYLESFPDLGVLSANQDFNQVSREYFDRYPEFKNRVIKFFDQSPLVGAKLAYVTFLANAYMFLPYFEYFKLPFILQLYPGGGFGLYNKESDAKLDRICSSPLLRRIITTQSITDDYLRERYGGRIRTDFIFGAVFDGSSLEFAHSERAYFGAGKTMLDVCFAAFKYTPRAADKGYPEFIEAAHRIAALTDKVRFHVIGNLSPEDIDVSALGGRILFHGSLVTSDLRRLFLEMDLIVSPNQPSGICSGNFDGFPTGSVTEAALSGAGMVITDPLGLNDVFPENDAIAIIAPTAESVANRILRFVKEPSALAPMARRGQQISAELYSPKRQIGLRLDILREEAQRPREAGAIVTTPVRTVARSAPKLVHEIMRVLNLSIPTDFGGGCPEDKALYMANLIVTHGMRYTVEIGVYRGRSFIPQAMAHQRTGGVVIGIDPYDSAAAQEADAPVALVDEITNWAKRTNFDEIFSKVIFTLDQLGLTQHARLIRATSDNALSQVEAIIDMLHIDGNHDTQFVLRDLANYLPLLKSGGFVIMDDIDWHSVAICLENLEGSCEAVEMHETWGVWRKR